MNARRVTRLIAACIALVGLGLVVAPGAHADDGAEVRDKGWWWRAQAAPVEIPTTPDVEPGQLVVEGTPEGATAIAAVAIDLADERINPILTLDVVDQTGDVGGSQAVLLACQAGSAWTGVSGGAWATAPSADCKGGSIQGVRSKDGTQWTLALGPLQFGNQINVVLTPGAGTAGNSAFRLVFETPAGGSVATTEGMAPAPDLSISSDDNLGGYTAPIASPSAPESSPSFAVPGINDAPAAVEPALPEDMQGRTATSPVLNAVTTPAAPISSSTDTASRFWGVLLILIGGAVAFRTSQQTVPGPRSLSRFGQQGEQAAATAVVATPSLGGLGRFRRERTTAPPKL